MRGDTSILMGRGGLPEENETEHETVQRERKSGPVEKMTCFSENFFLHKNPGTENLNFSGYTLWTSCFCP